MITDYGAPWHRESYDRFLQERLPELLSQRMPLTGYQAELTSETTAKVTVSVAGPSGEVKAVYEDLPRPDADGLLWLEQSKRPTGSGTGLHAYVVVPAASSENLDIAEIACIGEQLYDFIEDKLGEAGEDLPWDEALLRAWLPLDAWILNFTHSAQFLDTTNWLSRHVHPRRIWVRMANRMLTPGHVGRACPLETPEGSNVGKVISVSIGATIQNGRLIVIDDSPEAGFGLSGHMIPFIEHGSDARLTMACNIMRQYRPMPNPEPALVQTGHEPDAREFWCGRNLLTAYAPWGENTFEDGVVISQSCAQRFSEPQIEPGHYIANRHGAKCTVTQILPDDDMPHLNGVPAEIVYSPAGVSTRLNLGQLWEAVAGRIAHIAGETMIAPFFHGPSESDVRTKLRDLGLPEDGLDQLTLGKNGPNLDRPSCIGWVYWGRPAFLDRRAMQFSLTGPEGQQQGVLEYQALREIGAFETIRENYITRSARNPGAATLAERLMHGPVEQSSAPSPAIAELTRRLGAVGIVVRLSDSGMVFGSQEPDGGLQLVRPVAHPWLRGSVVKSVEEITGIAGFAAIAKINAQLEKLARSGAPEKLISKGTAELHERVCEYFEALITPDLLRWNETVGFSGQAALEPGDDLNLEEVGLPEEMAWGLFGPILTRELGDAQAVASRTPEAARALDAIMARSWVLLSSPTLYYDPSSVQTPLLACRPVRQSGNVIRIHGAVCSLMNVDFDGDHMSVLLPITDAAQREAGELLTARAYLERDPTLLQNIRPSMDSLWGLSSLSLTTDGRQELAALLGSAALPPGLLTKPGLLAALEEIRESDGLEAALDAAERLRKRGFEAARQSGWSIGPFLGYTLALPAQPEDDSSESWNRYTEEVTDLLQSKDGFSDNDTDPFRLAILSGARGNTRLMIRYISGWGTAPDAEGNPVRIGHGLRQGITPEESSLLAAGTRKGWQRQVREEGTRLQPSVSGFHVLARAMRAEFPGAVLARAAAAGESDPLIDLDSRLFVGLPPK